MTLSVHHGISVLACGFLLGTAGCSNPAASLTATEPDAGGSVTLSWRAPTANTNGTPIDGLAGYMIEYGPDPSLLSRSVKIPNLTVNTYTMQNLSPGVWYFSVRAFTSAGIQGARSRVVRVNVRRDRPR